MNPPSHSWLRRCAYTGITAALIFSVSVAIRLGLDTGDATPVHARAMEPRAVMVSEPVPAANDQVEMAPDVPAAFNAPEATVADSAPIPEAAAVAESAATTLPAAAVAAVKPARALFRLNGIFYTAARPSAIVNGETVFVGEDVNGAKVISISRDEVTLDINGERTVLGVPGANGGY